VTRFDEDLKAFADEMVVTMRQEDGVGLAATQVGKTIRLAVVDVTGGEGEAYVLINPFITWSSDDKAVEEEGCLSLPGIPRYKISRPARVTVRAYDCAGKEFTIEKADGLLARAMQHEIDHLNGIMYVDHLSASAETTQRQTQETGEIRWRNRVTPCLSPLRSRAVSSHVLISQYLSRILRLRRFPKSRKSRSRRSLSNRKNPPQFRNLRYRILTPLISPLPSARARLLCCLKLRSRQAGF
jgi:peptide deformylase